MSSSSNLGLRRRRPGDDLSEASSIDANNKLAQDSGNKLHNVQGPYDVTALCAFDLTDRAVSLLLTLVCAFTRLYRIGRRDIVSWDETHFGKFGANYLNRTFYHDVHPPLAKMLVGLSEFISGHNGTFIYKNGTKYPPYVNYVFQRSFMAIFGIMMVPFAYRTCRFLGFGRALSLMAASFIIFDNAICVMSRFILLDQPLLCFTSMSLLGYAGFIAQKNMPFSRSWWRWLIFTGIALGLVTSTKWVGFLIVALVGLGTIEELFILYCDTKTSVKTQLKHWGARVVCLIMIPILLYLASFKIHFSILHRRGTGDFKMPSSFQALQYNSVVAAQPHEVAFGSEITIRSHLPGFGLIYANGTYRFPDKDKEIVAAGMPGKQRFNWWRIISPKATWENQTSPVTHISDGSKVRFAHVGMKALLRTGTNKPYYLGWDRRVFIGENSTSLSPWDLWTVEIVDEESPVKDGNLHTVSTTFRLRNSYTGCLLHATPTRLPEWGRSMSELTCTDSNKTNAEGSLWNIEQVRDTRFKRANFRGLVKRRFLRDVMWINREMARSNNNLVPDHDHYKQAESSPWSWPFLLFPMRMVSWADSAIKYYEIGNPVLWWASTLCCLLYPVQMLYWLIRWQRGCSTWKSGEFQQFWDVSKLLWGGWALHYLPFFLMGRVTYIHHYLPALYFGVLLLAFYIKCTISWYLPKRFALPAIVLSVALAAFVFILFSPLTFGWDKPAKDLSYLEWLNSWNLIRDSHLL